MCLAHHNHIYKANLRFMYQLLGSSNGKGALDIDSS